MKSEFKVKVFTLIGISIVCMALSIIVGCGNGRMFEGPTGDTGQTGAMGPAGPTGVTGPQGEMGLVGPAGPIGATGLPGIAGPTGATGATGTAGVQGVPGLNGMNGTNGTNATSVTTVKFCQDDTSAFPEYGLVIGGNIYAVYWGSAPYSPNTSEAFLALIKPGSYQSTGGNGCHFTVHSDGTVTE